MLSLNTLYIKKNVFESEKKESKGNENMHTKACYLNTPGKQN